jgi:hypothetical protein
MTRTRTRRAAPVTRRRFLGTALLGTAAALAAAVPGVAATRRRTKPAPKPAAAARAPKLEAEIAKQKGYLTKTLDTIRAYELPPGSEQAFVFSAVKAKPRRGGAR